MTMQEEFVMVRQFRPNINEYSLEFPAGALHENEIPIKAAKREFVEETSYSSKFIYLGDFRLMMNRTNIKEHIFFGVNPQNVNQSVPEKGIEVHLVKRQELLELILAGKFKQLAGLGVIQLASSFLGLSIMSEQMDVIHSKFKKRIKNES